MPSEHPRRRFQDILENIGKIRRYVAGLDQEAFTKNDMAWDAVERCLARISEAAVKLGELAETQAPGPRWKDIRGIGNWLRHAYDGISTETIWQAITYDLDPLEDACKRAIAALPPDEPA